jgi:hypothetical protein
MPNDDGGDYSYPLEHALDQYDDDTGASLLISCHFFLCQL